MRYRTAIIHPVEAIDTASTLTLRIRDMDVISRMQIYFRVTKSKMAMDAPGAFDVTKIELVDGGDVLFSMTGTECQALNIYNRRCGTMCHGQHSGSNGEINYFGLDFGRWLWDPLLALDPMRFLNLQLKVSYTLTTSDTGVTAGEIEVISYLFDDFKPSPIGFLTAEEWYSFTPGADGSFEYIDLPVDRVMRKLLVRGYYDAREPWYELESIRLDEDNLKKIPLDMGLEKYYRNMKPYWTEISEAFAVIPQDASEKYYVTPTDYYARVSGLPTNALTFSPSWIPGGVITLVATAGTDLLGTAHGYLPHHCFEVPFGNDKDPDDWYDLTKIGSLRLRLESAAGGVSGTAQVVIEQLRYY